MPAIDIARHPIHLGFGATAEPQPAFTGDMDWFAAYGARHASDGADGRLVSMHALSESWRHWEMHPNGSEVVLCIAGAFTLVQETSDGGLERTRLRAGQYAINPPGVWHTADLHPAAGEMAAGEMGAGEMGAGEMGAGETATVLFITSGLGTRHRPR